TRLSHDIGYMACETDLAAKQQSLPSLQSLYALAKRFEPLRHVEKLPFVGLPRHDDRTRRTARATVQLHHPHLVPVVCPLEADIAEKRCQLGVCVANRLCHTIWQGYRRAGALHKFLARALGPLDVEQPVESL